MTDNEDIPPDQPARSKSGERWGCVIAALVLLLPLIWFFGDAYRLEKVSPAVTRAPSGCEIHIHQTGDWKSEKLSSGYHVENLEYPLKVMAYVTGCPGVPGGKPYAVQLLRQPSGRPVATGLDCVNVPQIPADLCRIEVPPIPTRADSHQFVMKIVRSKGERPEEIRFGVILTREWRSIGWDVMMSV